MDNLVFPEIAKKRAKRRLPNIPLNPTVLDAIAWATHDGRKGKGPPHEYKRLRDFEDGEAADHPDQVNLRALLLAACAGQEATLEFLFAVTGGSLSYLDLANAFGKSAGQVWRQIQQYLRRVGETISLARVAATCIERSESGFTLSCVGESVVCADAWAVSRRGLGARYASPPDLVQVTQFIADRYDALFGRGANHLGGWYDEHTGDYCLDVSRLIREKRQAVAFARRHKQVAITHLTTFATIRLDEHRDEKKRRAA